jgi:hypothetical protein
MDTTHDTPDLAAVYAQSVEREREAWHALHSHPPGTPERALAWDAWSEAIVHTNRAWRKLSASRIGRPIPQPAVAADRQHA